MSHNPKKKQNLLEGFNKFVIRNENGCWGWSGCVPKIPGYGQFRSSMKLFSAHRASWMINFGEIPKGINVLHKCDNKICSNPDHLFLGTQKDNIFDYLKKYKKNMISVSGENNIHSKLKKEQVLFIRNNSNLMKRKELSNMFNVSLTCINDILLNNTWRLI